MTEKIDSGADATIGALPDREPDNTFFEGEDGQPQGRSWNVEIEGLRATMGRISAGTKYRYSIDKSEIVFVHAGAVTHRMATDVDRGDMSVPLYSPYVSGMAFDLPVGQEFELDVLPKEKQKTEGAALGEPTPSDLIYTCFYPETFEEYAQISRMASTVDIGGRRHHYMGTNPPSGIPRSS